MVTTVGSLIKKNSAPLITQLEMAAKMDAVSTRVETPKMKMIASFTFSVLPSELSFLITSDLPVHSHGCLALTERRLDSLLKNSLKSECLQLPAEQPATFTQLYMSEIYN